MSPETHSGPLRRGARLRATPIVARAPPRSRCASSTPARRQQQRNIVARVRTVQITSTKAALTREVQMRFTKIEIHFESGTGAKKKKFRAVILDGGRVTAIRLAETPGNPLGPFSSRIPEGVRVFREDGTAAGTAVEGDTMPDGPEVCYQMGRQQVCW